MSDELPPLRLVVSERRFTRCQAWEDGCDYAQCPRWRNGAIINDEHCALDLIEKTDE